MLLYGHSVAECWLVNLAKKEIYVFWQPNGIDYKFSELVRLGETVKRNRFLDKTLHPFYIKEGWQFYLERQPIPEKCG